MVPAKSCRAAWDCTVTKMPRFYFHIISEKSTLRDEKGLDWPDDQTAIEYGQRIFKEISETERVRVSVENAQGREVADISAT